MSMQTSWVRTLKGTHFTGAILQNAKEDENLADSVGRYKNGAVIRRIVILSKENLDWEVAFWGNDLFATGDADTEKYFGCKRFVAADAKQIGGSGLWRYESLPLEIRYEDLDKTGEMHISLVNRSAAAKSAGAAGEITVLLGISP